MFSFGWVTQSKITRNIKVNNILTRVILQQYLSLDIGNESREISTKRGKN